MDEKRVEWSEGKWMGGQRYALSLSLEELKALRFALDEVVERESDMVEDEGEGGIRGWDGDSRETAREGLTLMDLRDRVAEMMGGERVERVDRVERHELRERKLTELKHGQVRVEDRVRRLEGLQLRIEALERRANQQVGWASSMGDEVRQMEWELKAVAEAMARHWRDVGR